MDRSIVIYKAFTIFSQMFITILVSIILFVFFFQPVYTESSRINYLSIEDSFSSLLISFSEKNSNDNNPIISTNSVNSIDSQYIDSPEFVITRYNPTLVIPSISVSGRIIAGETDATMNKGFWHYTSSSKSFKYGNTVIIGHRFLHLPPKTDTFYNLDKVKIKDEVIIKTDKGDITYQVIMKKIVNATDVGILDHTSEPRLILITCHPLWTSRQRLVIMAKVKQTSIKL